jgi:hypothetical protein
MGVPLGYGVDRRSRHFSRAELGPSPGGGRCADDTLAHRTGFRTL